ncbi:nickel-responsive transcriptional regulator NikR [Candidatus Woesearchaeota archaeon]|nr:nickel-responsive transcriptional regulator NikR [Candidatus Woesearchaeota archaeon]
MENIIRKGIAFNPEQLNQFDILSKDKGYKNRSEAIRDLIRKEIVEESSTDPETFMVGSLTLIYDHHAHNVQHELTHIQHHSDSLIRSTMHIHIDEHKCMEIIVLEGKVKDIKRLSDMMIATKGVSYGKLVLANSRVQ